MAEGRVRGFSIATRCATLQELIEKFRDRVDSESILVHAVESREIGTECAFAILLADKQVALAGTCVVRDVFTDGNNPFKRPGMRLGIKRLGPESQKVWAQLVAQRIAPRTATQAMPTLAPPPSRTSTQNLAPPSRISSPRLAPKQVVVMPRAAKSKGEAPALQVVRNPTPRRLATVQIPSRDVPRDEPLARAPRATPFDLDNVAAEAAEPDTIEHTPTAEPPPVAAPVPASPPRQETRTPGSPFILPANPLTNIDDASLEGLVDCRLFEENTGAPPQQFPAGTLDADDAPLLDGEPVSPSQVAAQPVVPVPGNVSDMPPPSAKLAKASAPAITAARPARAALPDGFVRTPLEPQRSEPLPLPPPPTRPDATPYAATKLPDLHVPGANDRVRPQLVKRRLRNQLLLAVLLVPLLGAGAVVGYMQLAAAPIATTAAPPTPATFATLEEPTLVRSPVEAAPVAVDDAVDETPAPPVPAKPQPIHAVLVRTWPIAATVKVGGRSFGSTPTYVKIPANTPVQLEIARPGFKPVTYPLISKTAIDRVFVRLERAKGKR